MDIESRRTARVFRIGDSNTITLTKEFESLGMKVDDNVLVTVTEGRIEIAPEDYYYEKFRKEVKKR